LPNPPVASILRELRTGGLLAKTTNRYRQR
jgi:hypothetical protein